MYASQKINNDPKPWVNPNDGERRAHQVKWISGADEHKPRPEFDNNPNPILVAFRRDLVMFESTMQGWEIWLSAQQSRLTLKTSRRRASECAEQARKVLARLAAL